MEPLREVVLVAARLTAGLKVLADGFGLNSMALTLNLAPVADGGPRSEACLVGLCVPDGARGTLL